MQRVTRLALAAAFLLACSDGFTSTDVRDGTETTALSNVSDGAHGTDGTAGFDPGLAPRAHICECTDATPCADPVVDAAADAKDGHYQYKWKTANAE